jgi:hypothetical protein
VQDFAQKFGAKSNEIGHTKTALAAKLANFFSEMDFCFVSSKVQLQVFKMTILSAHALPEK